MSFKTNHDFKFYLGRKTVVLFGDTTTGKSLLYERFMEYSAVNFKKSVTPLIMFDIEVEGKYVDLQIWEATDNEKHRSLRGVFYANLDVAILCYAIDNEKSYENIKHIYKSELNEKSPNTPIILVANKMDLSQSLEEKLISYEQGHQLAKCNKAFAYVETSAKHNMGIEKLITLAAKAAVRRRQIKCSIL